MTFEMNNIRKDSAIYDGQVTKTSPVVEVFAAMVNGSELSKFGAVADKAVAHIKSLGEKAEAGDPSAVAELNTIRRFVLEQPVMEELKLLGVFGSYQNVGIDETPEREVWTEAGEMGRIQAYGSDVTFPATVKNVYPVPTFTVSGGYAVDYRRVAMGDMSKENAGMLIVKTDILNKAKAAIVKKVYEAVKNATGVKYFYEYGGLTKDGVDAVLNKVRRFGRPSIIGDYAVLSQFSAWAGWAAQIDSINAFGVSQKALDEIQANGFISGYLGAPLVEWANPYNEYQLNAAGTDFKTMIPAGLAFIVPTGVQSPIATFSRGGLTSMTGNDVKSGKILTRFDVEVGVDVAKGLEHRIGVINDSQVSEW